jgi:hypothetical protein
MGTDDAAAVAALQAEELAKFATFHEQLQATLEQQPAMLQAVLDAHGRFQQVLGSDATQRAREMAIAKVRQHGAHDSMAAWRHGGGRRVDMAALHACMTGATFLHSRPPLVSVLSSIHPFTPPPCAHPPIHTNRPPIHTTAARPRRAKWRHSANTEYVAYRRPVCARAGGGIVVYHYFVAPAQFMVF